MIETSKRLMMLVPTLLALAGLAAPASAQAVDPHAGHNHAPGEHPTADSGPIERRTFEWPQEAVDAIGALPVQDAGRVKPLEVYGGLRMLMLNGKRKFERPDGTKQGAAEWTLDVLFFPEEAQTLPFIRVENDEVLASVGLDTGTHRKRDWYTYAELFPARDLIAQRGSVIAQKERSDQSPVERQLFKLAQDLNNLEAMMTMLDPLRVDVDISASPVLTEIFGAPVLRSVVDVLDHREEIAALMADADPELMDDKQLLAEAFRTIEDAKTYGGWGPGLVPPLEAISTSEAWWRVRDLTDLAMVDFSGSEHNVDTQLEVLRLLDTVERSKGDEQALVAAAEELETYMLGLASATDVPLHMDLEVQLYRTKPFLLALVFFMLGSLTLLLGALFKGARPFTWVTWGMGGLGLVLLIAGVVMRCIIRERPPVVSLYDTILFVTGVAVLACYVTEAITRMRVALGSGVVLGVIGMFLAGRFEAVEVSTAGDTMGAIVAVLDTNYYLAIHVTTIAIGYSGGLFASAIAYVYLLGKLFRWREGDKKFYRGIARMIYGVLCFSLIFSVFGTIMGGVWANDSWGRFWGWDPKENGALLICVWLLLTLHMRLGGFIKDRGIAVMAVGAGAVVAFSWWGVNLLEVGLHSYGWTSGVAMYLYTFYGVQSVVLLLSLGDHLGRSARLNPA